MADVVVAAGVDAARDLDLQRPDVALPVEVGEGLGDLLRDRDRPRRRQRAVVHARAGDDVGDQPDVAGGEPGLLQPRVDLRQVPARHVRQDQVLLVADADLVVAVGLGEVGDEPHLLGGRVARRAADRLQRDGDDARSGRACARRRWCRPRRAARRRASGGSGAGASKAGGAKAASISATSAGFDRPHLRLVARGRPPRPARAPPRASPRGRGSSAAPCTCCRAGRCRL